MRTLRFRIAMLISVVLCSDGDKNGLVDSHDFGSFRKPKLNLGGTGGGGGGGSRSGGRESAEASGDESGDDFKPHLTLQQSETPRVGGGGGGFGGSFGGGGPKRPGLGLTLATSTDVSHHSNLCIGCLIPFLCWRAEQRAEPDVWRAPGLPPQHVGQQRRQRRLPAELRSVSHSFLLLMPL